MFLLSPPSSLVPEEVPYNLLVKSLELEEGSSFWRGSLVPLPSLPGSPNLFRVLLVGLKASSNPFEEQVREPPLNNNGGEAERLLQAEVRDLTSQNVFFGHGGGQAEKAA